MAGYQRMDEDPSSVMSVANPQVHSLELGKEKDLKPHFLKFRRCCWGLMALAIVLPPVGWFVEESHIVFYEMLGFAVGLIVIGVVGLRTLALNVFRRLTSYRLYVHIYFLAAIVMLLANQALLTMAIANNNSEHCSHFSYYWVCKDRWGMMGAQMTLILFYPAIVFTVFIIYRYFLQTIQELAEHLLQRQI
jgi:hypothetical protein